MTVDHRTGWSDLLDDFDQALARAEAALDGGTWPEDGWTEPSLAAPGEPPTREELARYRQLAERANDVLARTNASMDAVSEELRGGSQRREALRGYAQAQAIEDRSAARH